MAEGERGTFAEGTLAVPWRAGTDPPPEGAKVRVVTSEGPLADPETIYRATYELRRDIRGKAVGVYKIGECTVAAEDVAGWCELGAINLP